MNRFAIFQITGDTIKDQLSAIKWERNPHGKLGRGPRTQGDSPRFISFISFLDLEKIATTKCSLRWDAWIFVARTLMVCSPCPNITHPFNLRSLTGLGHPHYRIRQLLVLQRRDYLPSNLRIDWMEGDLKSDAQSPE